MQSLCPTSDLERLIPMVTAAIGAESSKKDYARELRQFFSWYEQVQWMHPDGFCRSTVMAYREAMQAAGRGPVSSNKALCSIRALAREAGANGYMGGDAAARIEQVPQVERRGGKLGHWLSLAELKALLAAPPPTSPNRGQRDRTAIWIMGTCGLRREEAAALKFGQLQERDGRWVLVDVLGKGDKLRSIPVHPLAAVAIRQWCEHAGITDKDALILPTIRNPDRITTEPASGARLYDACKRYARAQGQNWAPHDLRRTFALLAKKGGADYEEIRQALGHSSIVTTEGYLRAPLSMENAATDKIAL